ncbi:MAG: TonB-dependent receptor plug domain-containing protein [Pseudomonadota bacterium]
MTKNALHSNSVGTALLLLVLSTDASFAQDTNSRDKNDETIVLEPITVTARRIEESLQNVPFSVSVIGEEDIENLRHRDSERLYRDIPNFNTANGRQPFGLDFGVIRGVGGFQTDSPDDTSVAYHIDGIPIPQGTIDAPFQDLERIEVLRGPQGTLFGRNAQAGAINLVTADPTDEPIRQATAEYGEQDDVRLSAVVGGKSSPDFRMRSSFSFERRDGFVEDRLGLNDDFQDEYRLTGSTKAIADVSDQTRASLTLRGGIERRGGDTGALREGSDFPVVEVDVANADAERDSLGAGLIVEHDLSDVLTLVSSTGYSVYQTDTLRDGLEGISFSAFAGLPTEALINPDDFIDTDERLHQFSQEIRADGEFDSRIIFSAGASAFYSEYTIEQIGIIPLFAFENIQENELTTESYSLFGEATTPFLSDRLRATFGLRGTMRSRGWKAT